MSIDQIIQSFLENIQQTSAVEYIAVVAGILSVWFSKQENVWVYPIGLINTIFYVYLSVEGHLFGEASVNMYYTIMSIYGWWLWTRKDQQQHLKLHITNSTQKEWLQQIGFFTVFYFIIFGLLTWAKKSFAEGAIPWADAFASATAYTGMWLMAKKKVESWFWWILTNFASIPLYFVKHYVLTSVYYLILLILAIFGWIAWRKKANKNAAKIN